MSRRQSRRGGSGSGSQPLFTKDPLPRRPTPPPVSNADQQTEAGPSNASQKRRRTNNPIAKAASMLPPNVPQYHPTYGYPSDPHKASIYSNPDAGPTCIIRGAIYIDELLQVPHIVNGGETLVSESHTMRVSGKGAIQACAVSMAGARVELVGSVGADGAWAKEYLRRRGVGVDYLEQLMDRPSGRTIIQVTPNEEKATIVIPGANSLNLHPASAHLHPPVSHVLLQNEITASTTREWINEAAARNLTVIYNPSPLPMKEELSIWPWEKIQFLILNEVEASAFVSSFPSLVPEDKLPPLGPTLPQSIETVYHTLIHLSYHTPLSNTGLVITLASKGVIALLPTAGSRDAKIFYEAATALHGEIREPGGAGSTFTGYLVAGLMEISKIPRDQVEPNDWELLIWRAVIAAGMAIERPGITDAIPHRQEVEARLGYLRKQVLQSEGPGSSAGPSSPSVPGPPNGSVASQIGKRPVKQLLQPPATSDVRP